MKIVYLLFMLYLLIESIPAYIKASYLEKRGKLKEAEKFVFDKIHSTANRFLSFAKIPVEVSGVDNIPKDRAVVFICNHQGYYDIPILLGALKGRTSYVAKIELEKVPILSGWMKKIGCIFVDRGNVRQSFNEMKKAVKLFKKGLSLVIFPEGIISGGSEIGEFKSGAFRLAIENKLTIVPITLKGEYQDIIEKYWIKPEKVTLYFSKPIYTDELNIKQHKELAKDVKNKIIEKLN